MKTRESGMPSESLWQGFFEPAKTLQALGLVCPCRLAVDFGCGYGTFAIPAAAMIDGTVLALDIDPEMVETTRAKATGILNLQVAQRDFVETGSGLEPGTADYVMLFNLLHAVESAALLAEARRILNRGGTLGVMHWNYDPETPRGPSMDIRLRPEQCRGMVEQAGFVASSLIQLPPYHYGFRATRT